ncbi:CheR family methyltransferase [Chitinimonas sp. BJB300]|uniref:CheR family methyltransferase n=1 Tax=Chitinimonas sp. BJB300 TaxID=1559339 RepID=UPI000C0FE4A1|nr:CheR family methyltransferase [Chitinimonas sp. BJB300]PHV11818.1 chemotaxis protein CheR [Chitinimonas sp. BJB300]TSJ87029.1 protein-glutamate O-methyltransferase CheR [Chitinimonas sp. BJB300]
MDEKSNATSELAALLETIFTRYQYDFRHYAQPSLKRRVLHAISRLNHTNLTNLHQKVTADSASFQELLQYLTVPVSDMFRDPAYFRRLRDEVLPVLATYPRIRIWVAGCSTGEEVYSLAILLREEGLLERSQIYATDINPRNLARAERGIFPIKHLPRYTSNYQQAGGKAAFSDYYLAAYGAALIDQSLRQYCVFSDHSLATDNVFVETQFVSCRNVLIYFDHHLQARALGLFHDSLVHRGFLGLGSKESIQFSPYKDQFDTIARAERIYRKH